MNKGLYNILNWGEGYFDYNQKGELVVQGTSLTQIIAKAQEAELHFPLLLRFKPILKDRVEKIQKGFNEAIEDLNYKASYQLVYPIKVNQDQHVVDTLLNTPSKPIGLEAGSKTELLAVLSLLEHHPRATIICNGYKDVDYIRLAFIAQKMGHQVFIVIEKMSELTLIIKLSKALNIQPKLGLRMRLATIAAGKWAQSGGARSKFGLNTNHILQLIKSLKAHQMLYCLELLHCHLGSQVANLQDIHHCMQEVAQYYAALRAQGASIKVVDVGGGLAIDYEGRHTSSDCSMNYTIKDYAHCILSNIKKVCDAHALPLPNIISESGRALTAYHAILVTNIHDIEKVEISSHPFESQHPAIADSMVKIFETMTPSCAIESYQLASEYIIKAYQLFSQGELHLNEKTSIEDIFLAICQRLKKELDASHPLFAEMEEKLATKVYCNLSFFQSLPDAWAIGQVFPIVPLSQANNPLTMQSVLYDLSCDSDGVIHQYVTSDALSKILPLPEYNPNKPYLLGFFLVGAYQEALGNLHNLFGKVSSVLVDWDDKHHLQIQAIDFAKSAETMLTELHYTTSELLQNMYNQEDLPKVMQQLNQSSYLRDSHEK